MSPSDPQPLPSCSTASGPPPRREVKPRKLALGILVLAASVLCFVLANAHDEQARTADPLRPARGGRTEQERLDADIDALGAKTRRATGSLTSAALESVAAWMFLSIGTILVLQGVGVMAPMRRLHRGRPPAAESDGARVGSAP